MGSRIARAASTFEDVLGPARERAVPVKAIGLALSTAVCTILILSSVLFVHVPPEHDWRDGGSTVPTDVLSEAEVDEDILSEEQALQLALYHLDSPCLGNITSFGGDDVEARLVVYHTMGHIKCWQFWDSSVNVSITADEGEPVYYWTRASCSMGYASEETVREAAIDIVSRWGGIPSDAIGPNVSTRWMTALCASWREWEVRWEREKDGITSTDRIVLRFTDRGSLVGYYRNWNMDLDEVDTEFKVTREIAIAIAEGHDESRGNLSSCEMRIVRPTGHGTGSGDLYGTRPTCVWVIHYSAEEGRYAHRISIHARTGEVVHLNP